MDDTEFLDLDKIELTPEARSRLRRILEIRAALGSSSVSKFKAFTDRADADDRMRGTLIYHGASTGRWTAKGPQLQNLPSRDLVIESDEVPQAIESAKAGVAHWLYDSPIAVAKACVRGCIVAGKGNKLIAADFSAIEGRVLAWLAEEHAILNAYIEGMRLYCVAAAGIYNTPYEKINAGRKTDPVCKKMDAVGKVAELACGYQGAVGAFRGMERSQGMNLGMTDEEVSIIVSGWRGSRGNTCRLWKGLEHAAFEAVSKPGTVARYGRIAFKVIGNFLLMKLPSGRFLYYCRPSIREKDMPWKDENGAPVKREVVSYWGVDSQTKRWSRCYGYGGLWTENATQAIARDLMVLAMIRLDKAGYKIILTVHDEVAAEVPLDFGSVKEFEQIMVELPAWADGLPVAAEGWEGERYRK